jgi:hypothetical protein
MKQTKIVKRISCPKCNQVFECKGLSGEKKNIICPGCNVKGIFYFPELKPEKINLLELIQLPYLIAVIPIMISHFFFYNENLAIFFTFMALVPIFTFFNFDGRIPIVYALIMLALSAMTIGLTNYESFANQMAIYSYWLLVVGVLCLGIKFLKK